MNIVDGNTLDGERSVGVIDSAYRNMRSSEPVQTGSDAAGPSDDKDDDKEDGLSAEINVGVRGRKKIL